MADRSPLIVRVVWRGVAFGPRWLPPFGVRPSLGRAAMSERTARVATTCVALTFILATTLGLNGIVAQRGAIALEIGRAHV